MSSIDPLISSAMDDWGDILNQPQLNAHRDFQFNDEDFESTQNDNLLKIKCFVNPTSKLQLSYLWFQAACDGSSIKYPINNNQIQSEVFRQSTFWIVCIYISILIMLICPVLTPTICSNSLIYSDSSEKHESKVILDSVYMICLGIQFLDILAEFSSAPLKSVLVSKGRIKLDSRDLWFYLRLTVVFVQFVDNMVYFSNSANRRITRCLTPFFLVITMNNMRYIVHGVFLSFLKTITIYMRLILFVLLWGLTGYCLFYQFDNTAVGHFRTVISAIYTSFHCWLSRPTILYQMTYLNNQHISLFYFIFLTLFADILGVSIILAISTRNFRYFGSKVFKVRLKYRKNALRAIYFLLSTDSGISISAFTAFCHVNFMFAPENSQKLFSLEAKGSKYVNEKSFFRLCGALSTGVSFTESTLSSLRQIGRRSSTYIKEEDLLATSNPILHSPPTDAPFWQSKKPSATKRSSLNPFAFQPEDTQNLNSNSHQSNSDSDHDSDSDSPKTSSKIPFSFGTDPDELNPTSKSTSINNPSSTIDLVVISQPESIHNKTLIERFVDFVEEASNLPLIQDIQGRILAFMKFFVVNQVKITIPPRFRTLFAGSTTYQFAWLDFLELVLNFLLLVDMAVISQNNLPLSGIVMAWILFILFNFELATRFIVLNLLQRDLYYHLILNMAYMASLISASVLTGYQSDSALNFFLIIQFMRYLGIFRALPGFTTLQAVIPIIWRSVLLFCLVIYFYSIFATLLMCPTLDSTGYIPNADDDSGKWIYFSNLLNFNSFLRSLYTLMQVALLGNWSFIMDAAVLNSSNLILTRLYFYLVRISMVIIFIPILMSFIIQSFIQQLAVKSKNKERLRERLQQQQQQQETFTSFKIEFIEVQNYQSGSLYQIYSNQILSDSVVDVWSPDGRGTITEQVSASANIQKESLKSRNSDHIQQLTLVNQQIVELATTLNIPPPSEYQSPPELAPFFFISEDLIHSTQESWVKMVRYDWPVSDSSTLLSPACELIETSTFTAEEKKELSFQWFLDGINGKEVLLTCDSYFIPLYQLFRSSLLNYTLIIIVIIQVIISFLVQPSCKVYDPNNYSLAVFPDSVSTSFNLISATLYLFDTFLEAWISLALRKQRGTLLVLSNWCIFRVLACSIVIWICLIELSFNKKANLGNVRTSLLPIIMISRENDFRQMIHGLAVAIRKSKIVYELLFILLLLFSFLGYILFQKYPVNQDYFGNLAISFLTTVRSFTSAPYALLVANKYNDQAVISLVFFIVVTFATELICINLIIAVGNAALKNFSDFNLIRRLNYRRTSLLLIWRLFTRQNGFQFMDRFSWLTLCSGMKKGFSIQPKEASLLFDYMLARQRSHYESFGLSSGLPRIRSALPLFTSTSNTSENVFFANDTFLSQFIDIDHFFKLMSLLHLGIFADETVQSLRFKGQTETTLEVTHRTIELSIRVKKATQFTHDSFYLDPELSEKILSFCRWAVTKDFMILKFKLGIFRSVGIFFRLFSLLELVQSTHATGGTNANSWNQFGYFLESYFWIEMSILMIATGERTFFQHITSFYTLLMNLLSLLGYILIGALPGNVLGRNLVIVSQCIRLLFVFGQGNDNASNRVGYVFNTYMRVLCIIATIIYFFALLGENQYCGILDPSNVENNIKDDDTSWLTFSNVLVFNNFLQSFFTMFEEMVQSTWFYLMDATLDVVKVSPYFFFLTFRLLLTVVVLPLLMSFVMRAYISYSDAKSNQRKLNKLKMDDFDLAAERKPIPSSQKHRPSEIELQTRREARRKFQRQYMKKRDEYSETFVGVWITTVNPAGLTTNEERCLPEMTNLENLDHLLLHRKNLRDLLQLYDKEVDDIPKSTQYHSDD